MEPEALARSLNAVASRHRDRPDAAGHASQHVELELRAGREEVREPLRRLLERESATAEQLDVCETVCEGERQLLHRVRARLADVVAGDRQRIPARHFADRELHHVGDEPK